MKYIQSLQKLVLLSVFLLTITPLKAIMVKNDVFKYKLSVPDSCVVYYEGKDSSFVHIVSPDGMSHFYVIGLSTGDSQKVFNNDFMEMADSCYFKGLNREPDENDKPFFLARQDHYYNLEDSTFCRTRIILLNDKAILLAGFCKTGDNGFIDECVENFQSATMLGMIATFFIFLVWIGVILTVCAVWSDNKPFSIIIAIVGIAAFYYIHYYLDYSFNKLMLSEMG